MLIYSYFNALKTSTTEYKNRENKILSKETIQKIYSVFHSILKVAYQ